MAHPAFQNSTTRPAITLSQTPRTMGEFHRVADKAASLSELGDTFSAMIWEMGFSGHCCIALTRNGAELQFGDVDHLPENLLPLLSRARKSGRHRAGDLLILPVESWHENALFLCMFGREHLLDARESARLSGWAEVYASFASALLERAQDVPTAIGLGLAQRQCLGLVLVGRTDLEIAESLGITPLAVRGHIADAVEKLDVATRAEAVSIAARRGWLAGINGAFTTRTYKQ